MKILLFLALGLVVSFLTISSFRDAILVFEAYALGGIATFVLMRGLK